MLKGQASEGTVGNILRAYWRGQSPSEQINNSVQGTEVKIKNIQPSLSQLHLPSQMSSQQQPQQQQSQQHEHEDGQNKNNLTSNLPLDLPLRPEPLQQQQQEQQQQVPENNSKYTDDNIIPTGSPLLIARSGIGQAATNTKTNSNVDVITIRKNEGPPLLRFLSKGKDMDTTPVLTTVVTNNPAGIVNSHNNITNVVATQPSSVTSGLVAASHPPEIISSESEEQPVPEEHHFSFDFEQWDSELWSSRIFHEIRTAKKERNDELLLIKHRRQELEEERQQIAQIRCNLEARESKVLELEPFIPLARQLQAMKIDITNFLPWVETINEYAVTRNTDLTTASLQYCR